MEEDRLAAHVEIEERELLKTMRWWDGFVVCLANPGFLIAALGGSVLGLGTAGATLLWVCSVLLGFFQNLVYAELALMFPTKAGGISLFAHEAWRKYFSPIGAISTFGYWFAWSSVLAVNGLVVGTLIQAKWFSSTTFSFAVVSVAAAVEVSGGVVQDCRLALGGVAHVPWRASRAEAALRGQPATEQSFAAAADAELEQAKPLRDNGFKVPLARNMIVRILEQLCAR